jgi:hypothetical protein
MQRRDHRGDGLPLADLRTLARVLAKLDLLA